MHNVLKNMISLRFMNVVDSSRVEGVSVDLQVDEVHCGTVQAASLSASPSRLVIFTSIAFK